MFDIVTSDQQKLALAIKIESVDNSKARLAPPGILSPQADAATGEAAQHKPHDRDEREDDGEAQKPLRTLRNIDPEQRFHLTLRLLADAAARVCAPPAS
jgi:hypothetical protein